MAANVASSPEEIELEVSLYHYLAWREAQALETERNLSTATVENDQTPNDDNIVDRDSTTGDATTAAGTMTPITTKLVLLSTKYNKVRLIFAQEFPHVAEMCPPISLIPEIRKRFLQYPSIIAANETILQPNASTASAVDSTLTSPVSTSSKARLRGERNKPIGGSTFGTTKKKKLRSGAIGKGVELDEDEELEEAETFKAKRIKVEDDRGDGEDCEDDEENEENEYIKMTKYDVEHEDGAAKKEKKISFEEDVDDEPPKTTKAKKHKLKDEDELPKKRGRKRSKPAIKTKPPAGPQLSFEERITQLEHFVKGFGHARVAPSHDKDLAHWVRRIRDNYRDCVNKPELLKKTPITPFQLTPERIDILSGMKFEFKLRNIVTVDWEEYYNQLLQYKEVHGHVNVPRFCKENFKLAEWVRRQRRDYRMKRRLFVNGRYEKLSEIGFVFEPPNCKNPTFEDRLEECKDFRRQFGHLIIPRDSARDPSLSADDRSLRQWALKIRREYKRYRDGLQSYLDKRKVKALDELGFSWTIESSAAHGRGRRKREVEKETLPKYTDDDMENEDIDDEEEYDEDDDEIIGDVEGKNLASPSVRVDEGDAKKPASGDTINTIGTNSTGAGVVADVVRRYIGQQTYRGTIASKRAASASMQGDDDEENDNDNENENENAGHNANTFDAPDNIFTAGTESIAFERTVHQAGVPFIPYGDDAATFGGAVAFNNNNILAAGGVSGSRTMERSNDVADQDQDDDEYDLSNTGNYNRLNESHFF